jgi:hypothetical protein
MLDRELSFLHAAPHQMVTHIYVLTPFMEYMIFAQGNGRLIVDLEHRSVSLAAKLFTN